MKSFRVYLAGFVLGNVNAKLFSGDGVGMVAYGIAGVLTWATIEAVVFLARHVRWERGA